MDAVIRVGDGRGFVVKDAGRARLGSRNERIVITAAHCLPFFPPCHAFSYLQDRTYKALLAPLGQEPTVWAECYVGIIYDSIEFWCAPPEWIAEWTQKVFVRARITREIDATAPDPQLEFFDWGSSLVEPLDGDLLEAGFADPPEALQ